MASIIPHPVAQTQTPPVKKSKSPFQLALERFVRNKMAMFGVVILLLVTVISLAAPLLTQLDPNHTDMYNTDGPPDGKHLLGTDELGRDLFARLLYGGRISLLIGVFTMLATVLIGIVLGAIAGYYGGKIDAFIMRVADIMLILPGLLIIIFVVSIMERTDEWTLILILSLTSWASTTRLIRGEMLSIREREYVLSAKAIGCSDFRIILKHMIPNAIPTIIVNATLMMAGTIVAEAALSYLGFGVPPTTPSWGNMLNEARDITVITDQPWLWIPPGAMVVITVLAINFIGDGLRDAFDTKSTRR